LPTACAALSRTDRPRPQSRRAGANPRVRYGV